MNTDFIKTSLGPRFHHSGAAQYNRRLFTVNADIPLVDALNSVSCLLSALEEGIMDAAMGDKPLENNAAWLAHHTLESAKAVVDSLIRSAESLNRTEKQTATVWKRENGFISYFILDDVLIQRAPYGKFGPFPTATALRDALDRLQTKYPELALVSRKASLGAELINEAELDAEHARTLGKLTAMGV